MMQTLNNQPERTEETEEPKNTCWLHHDSDCSPGRGKRIKKLTHPGPGNVNLKTVKLGLSVPVEEQELVLMHSC
jgi:hypothetical protein